MIVEKFVSPRCPKFPDTSIFLGRFASWFYHLCAWMKIPLGAFRKPLHVLSRRKDEVLWARKPWHERMIGLIGVVGVAVAAYALLRMRPPRGVRPPGGL